MAEETIISWTPANWITVSLMVALAFAIVGFAWRFYQSKKGA